MSSQTQTKPTEAKNVAIQPYFPLPRRCPIETCTPLGSKYIIKQKYTYDEDGNKIALPGEKLDLDAFIQASRESCDIAAIIAKYQAGDESVINVNPNVFYGDSTSLPKDLYDVKRMNDLYDNISGSFEKLPDDLKALFNNDSAEFLNAILENKANGIIEGYNASKNVVEDKGEVNNG